MYMCQRKKTNKTVKGQCLSRLKNCYLKLLKFVYIDLARGRETYWAIHSFGCNKRVWAKNYFRDDTFGNRPWYVEFLDFVICAMLMVVALKCFPHTFHNLLSNWNNMPKLSIEESIYHTINNIHLMKKDRRRSLVAELSPRNHIYIRGANSFLKPKYYSSITFK